MTAVARNSDYSNVTREWLQDAIMRKDVELSQQRAEIERLTKERGAAQANADENYRRLMAERERCAKIAEADADKHGPFGCGPYARAHSLMIAAAIRKKD